MDADVGESGLETFTLESRAQPSASELGAARQPSLSIAIEDLDALHLEPELLLDRRPTRPVTARDCTPPCERVGDLQVAGLLVEVPDQGVQFPVVGLEILAGRREQAVEIGVGDGSAFHG